MGRFSGLATALSTVADKLRADREMEGKKNLLGMQGLITGNITPTQETEGSFDIPGMGRVKPITETKEWKPRTQEEALGFERAKIGIKTEIKSPQQEKAELDLQDRKRQLGFTSQNVKDKAQESLDTISEVKNGIKYFGPASLVPAIPGIEPDKVKWQANFDRLKAKLIVDLMTEMKNASKTGATGFGQLNKDELKVLQDGSTALKKTMLERDALEILNKMELKLQKVAQGSGQPLDESINDMVTIQDITGKTKQMTRQEAIRKGYING